MSQHPSYSPDIKENATSLRNILYGSLQYGFAHYDSTFCQLDGALELLYRPGKDRDDDSYLLTDYVDLLGLTGDDAWQFVQDLRNAIGIVLTSDKSYSSEELAREIKDARDLPYLKMHIRR